MLFEINPQGNTPIYQQLKEQIILGIATKALIPGDLLPTVRQLADEIGVNAMTISKAYASLKEEGYLISDRRKGTAVAQPATFSSSEETEYAKRLHFLLAEGYLHGLTKIQLMNAIEQQFSDFEKGSN